VVLTEPVTLIDAASLAVRLADVDPPSVLDVRWSLAGPGREAYLDGHIPGAAFVDLDRDLCGPPGPAGRHPLPDPAHLQDALRRAGVRQGHLVVAYDGGESQAAARLWWTLRWAGHEDVAVLDGGFAGWVAADRPVEPGEAIPPPGDVVVRPGNLPLLDATAAAGVAAEGTLLDSRVAFRYAGEQEPIDPVAGHIPGAVNVPAARLLADDGTLRPPDELRRFFEDAGVGSGPIGAYCGSGVTAANTVLALHQAGFTDAALYVGSWSNWVADPDRPVATGGDA
jgi:thiosulfate/3-mercaptopyruvate sulfurtransferase